MVRGTPQSITLSEPNSKLTTPGPARIVKKKKTFPPPGRNKCLPEELVTNKAGGNCKRKAQGERHSGKVTGVRHHEKEKKIPTGWEVEMGAISVSRFAVSHLRKLEGEVGG